MLDERFAAARFAELGLGSEAAAALANELATVVLSELETDLSTKVKDIVHRLNAMGHQLRELGPTVPEDMDDPTAPGDMVDRMAPGDMVDRMAPGDMVDRMAPGDSGDFDYRDDEGGEDPLFCRLRLGVTVIVGTGYAPLIDSMTAVAEHFDRYGISE
jgi:hypothetical protein